MPGWRPRPTKTLFQRRRRWRKPQNRLPSHYRRMSPRLHRDARDVVQRLLLRQVGTGSLTMEFEAPGARIFRAQPVPRYPRPDTAPGAELPNLLEKADGDVEKEARSAARRIVAGAPLVHRWHKRFLRRLDDPAPLSQAELKEGFACYDTEDFRVGYTAFMAKKKPRFTGR